MGKIHKDETDLYLNKIIDFDKIKTGIKTTSPDKVKLRLNIKSKSKIKELAFIFSFLKILVNKNNEPKIISVPILQLSSKDA